MVETWVLWLFIVGLATGIVVTLVAVVRLPRGETDVSDAERPTEAAWIGSIIERNGGIAPVLLVEEILELHQAYLREARPPVPSGYSLPEYVPPPGYVPPGYSPPGYAPPEYVPTGYSPPDEVPTLPPTAPPTSAPPPAMPPTPR